PDHPLTPVGYLATVAVSPQLPSDNKLTPEHQQTRHRPRPCSDRMAADGDAHNT
ncbi:hypothetical protein chiPu_0028144, partial [Chiloscyllium punctatum]|nr:hypothetical protein [Chiloscyllium punctatum]